MKAHPRIRKTIKWGGAAVTVLLVVVWVGSVLWYCGYFKAGRIIGLYDAEFVVTYHVNMNAPKYDGLHLGRREYGDPWEWWFHFQTTYARERVLVPLWPFVLACFSITLAAWRLDTQARRPGLFRLSSAMAPKIARYILPVGFVICGWILLLIDRQRPHMARQFDTFAMASLPTAMLLYVIPLPYRLGVLLLGGLQYFGVGYGVDGAIGAFRYARAKRRQAAGPVCVKCGYDLTGLAAGAVCPECGAASSTSPPPLPLP